MISAALKASNSSLPGIRKRGVAPKVRLYHVTFVVQQRGRVTNPFSPIPEQQHCWCFVHTHPAAGNSTGLPRAKTRPNPKTTRRSGGGVRGVTSCTLGPLYPRARVSKRLIQEISLARRWLIVLLSGPNICRWCRLDRSHPANTHVQTFQIISSIHISSGRIFPQGFQKNGSH